MIRRSVRVLLAVIVALASLAAFDASTARAEPERVRLTLWHAYRGAEQDALDAIVDRFRKAHPSVPVDVLALPFDAYASKLEAAIPHGHGPDVFLDAHERFADYRQKGLISPIGSLAELGLSKSEFDAVALGALTQGNDLFGVPLSLKCLALYLRAPTWPAGSSPSSLDAIVARASLQHPTLAWEASNAYGLAPLVHAFGASMIDASGRYAFADGPAEQALSWITDATRRGAVPEEASGALVTQLFSTGTSDGSRLGADAAISGPWLAAELPDTLAYRVVPIPPVHDGGAPSRPYLTIEAAMLSSRAQDVPSAKQLIAAIAGRDGSIDRAIVGHQVVADKLAWSDPRLAGDAVLAGFSRAASDAVAMPTMPAMRAAWEPTTRAIQKVLRGDATPRAAIDEALHRFEDVTRPLPAPADPRPWLLALGLFALAVAGRAVSRARDAEVRASLAASIPAYKYVAHAVVVVVLLVVVPLVMGAATSLFATRGNEARFVGFANYAAILSARGGPLLASGSFYAVLLVTVLWTVTNVVLHLAFGVGLALLLARPALAMRGLYRVLLVVPWAVPSYVSALAWKGMFHRQLGAVNAILALFHVQPIAWFSSFATAFSANVATNVWLGFPFMMVVTLGALAGISREVLEAAEIDGATKWQRFWRVTFPLLRPTLGPAVLLGAVWTFNMFNVVFLVSGGEPDGRTEILVSEAYRWAFTRQAQYGYAAAYAVLIFLLLAIGTRLMRGPAPSEATR